MNKHLNNWLDEVEGKPKDTSNTAIVKELERQGFKKKEIDGLPYWSKKWN